MNTSKAWPLANKKLNQDILKLIRVANSFRSIKKGTNETTKAINRDLAKLVVLAADTEPLEILLHIPICCEEKDVPYIFVETKSSLSRAAGQTRFTTAVAVLCDENRLLEKQLEQ